MAKGLNVELRLSGRFDNRKKPYNGDNLFRSAQMAIPTYSMYANDNPDYWGAVGDMANPCMFPIRTTVVMKTACVANLTARWLLPGSFPG